jgi:hypothetical protein
MLPPPSQPPTAAPSDPAAIQGATPASSKVPSPPPPAVPVDRFERAMKLWERILGTVTAAALVVAGVWTAWTYFKQQQEVLDQKRREYRLMVRNEKRELYQPLCSAAARIATAKTMRDAEPDIAKFWELYWGQVHFIPDEGFQRAKERFRDELVENLGNKDEPPSYKLRNLSNELAMAVQEVEIAYEPP